MSVPKCPKSPNLRAHFGDLMSPLDLDGLTTKNNAELLASFTPMERVALTANGNLQRIMSAFYNSPVRVVVLHNARDEGTSAPSLHIYRRQVELRCFGRVFCVATSNVEISDRQMMAEVASDEVGLGQLFRHHNLLPNFKLLQTGREERSAAAGADGGVWRRYELFASGIRCRIHEQFVPALFDLGRPPPRPSDSARADAARADVAGGAGDGAPADAAAGRPAKKFATVCTSRSTIGVGVMRAARQLGLAGMRPANVAFVLAQRAQGAGRCR